MGFDLLQSQRRLINLRQCSLRALIIPKLYGDSTAFLLFCGILLYFLPLNAVCLYIRGLPEKHLVAPPRGPP